MSHEGPGGGADRVAGRPRVLLVAGSLLHLVGTVLAVALDRPALPIAVATAAAGLLVALGLGLLIRAAAAGISLLLVGLDVAVVWLVSSGVLVSLPWPGSARDGGLVVIVADLLVLVVLVGCWVTAWHGIRDLGRLAVGLLAMVAVDVLLVRRLVAGSAWTPGWVLVGAATIATGTALLAALRVGARPGSRWREAGLDPVRGLVLPGVAAALGSVALLVDSALDQHLTGPALVGLGVLLFVPRALLTRVQDQGFASGELAGSEEDRRRFEALVEASTDFVALAGVDGRLRYLNPAGRRMVGLGPDEDVSDRSLVDLVDDRPRPTFEDFGAADDRLRRLVTGAEQWPGEQLLRPVDGGPGIPVISSTFRLPAPGTGEELVGTIHRDVGEAVVVRRQLVEAAHQRQQLLTEVVRAQEEERARIAADVHDDSVQSLAAVDLRLQLLDRRLGPELAEASASLREVRDAVRTATGRLRHLLFDLDVPVLETDLVTAVRDAAAFVLGSSTVRWSVEGPEDLDLPEVTRVVGYRIVQQALQNVREHAEASQVRVEVRETAHQVVLEVRDDGRGYDPSTLVERAGHLGLRSMRQRALAVGGRVEVDTAPGQGTTVTLVLPRTPIG